MSSFSIYFNVWEIYLENIRSKGHFLDVSASYRYTTIGLTALIVDSGGSHLVCFAYSTRYIHMD